MRIDQRTARIARVHRGIGLDESLDAEIVGNHAQVTRLGAHDAGRDGRLQVERRTDRQHPLAQAQCVRRTERHGRQVGGLDFQQRKVGRRVLADELGLERAAVVELHFELRGPVHDVVVGDDIAVLGDDDTRTAGTLLAELRPFVIPLRDTEELQERVVTPAPGHLHLLHGLDVDDGFHRVLGGVRQVGVLLGLV